MTGSYDPASPPGGPPGDRCSRHPDQVAYVRCQRCGRSVCPACQVSAPVGVQCVDCVAQASQAQPRTRSVLGASVSRGAPLVTIILGAVCIAVAAVDFFIPDGLPSMADRFGMVPALAAEEPWRVVTSMFVHVNAMHLIMNLVCLWMVGSFLEPVLGRWRFAALSLLSGIGGGVAVLGWARATGLPHDWLSETTYNITEWWVPTIGASGIVFGLFGATVWVTRRLGGDLRAILSLLAINVVYSVIRSGEVSWQGHVGGLIVGLAIGAVFAFVSLDRYRAHSIAATAMGVAVLAGLYAVLCLGLPSGAAGLWAILVVGR